MRFLLLFLVLSASLTSYGAPVEHVMTVKDRLRIHLWQEGIQSGFKLPPKERGQKLPIELERPLSKL